MKMVHLFLQGIADKAALHDNLTKLLELPEYYGRNLDALYDILTERGEQWAIWIYPDADTEARLGHYAEALYQTFQDACDANPALNICMVEPEVDTCNETDN